MSVWVSISASFFLFSLGFKNIITVVQKYKYRKEEKREIR
jgi:hypothetical protein